MQTAANQTDRNQDQDTSRAEPRQDEGAQDHFYDDGLVHSHGWAASSNER